jgi:hypothetical protein
MMLDVVTGDIWDWYDRGFWVVVTTNIGWCPQTGMNNMGAGLAMQAAIQWPCLSRWYGDACREHGPDTPVTWHALHRLVFFPVKPLIADAPERSWDQRADLDLIERSARQLAGGYPQKTALALPGCGNGGLFSDDVLPILDRHLDPAWFVVVDPAAPRGRVQKSASRIAPASLLL